MTSEITKAKIKEIRPWPPPFLVKPVSHKKTSAKNAWHRHPDQRNHRNVAQHDAGQQKPGGHHQGHHAFLGHQHQQRSPQGVLNHAVKKASGDKAEGLQQRPEQIRQKGSRDVDHHESHRAVKSGQHDPPHLVPAVDSPEKNQKPGKKDQGRKQAGKGGDHGAQRLAGKPENHGCNRQRAYWCRTGPGCIAGDRFPEARKPAPRRWAKPHVVHCSPQG